MGAEEQRKAIADRDNKSYRRPECAQTKIHECVCEGESAGQNTKVLSEVADCHFSTLTFQHQDLFVINAGICYNKASPTVDRK